MIARSDRSGFTLTELLVSLAVIGILATMAMPTVQSALVRARVAQTVSDLRVLRDGIELFAADTGSYPLGSTEPPLSFLTNYDVRDVLKPLIGTYLPNNPGILEDFFSLEAVTRVKSSIRLDLTSIPDRTGYSYFDYAHFLVPPWQPRRAFALVSLGPDGEDSGLGIAVRQPVLLPAAIYAPSNGIRSPGDIGIGSSSLSVPLLR
ncbi:MAG: prepilin-type N-terminal cleavage/methylation domain-containing protein [bacterium]